MDLHPRRAALGENGPEPLSHPGPHVLAVAGPILDERDVVAGEDVQRVRPDGGEPLDHRAAPAEVTLVPDRGGERVGVADEQAPGRTGGTVLMRQLGPGDVLEVAAAPLDDAA